MNVTMSLFAVRRNSQGFEIASFLAMTLFIFVQLLIVDRPNPQSANSCKIECVWEQLLK